MSPQSSIQDAKWIWIKDFDDSVNPGKFLLFRKTFNLDRVPLGDHFVCVSADTRYRMLVNGKRTAFGPCKSYLERWYYETKDISPYLVAGKNVISIRVLRFSPAHAGNASMMRANIPGLILQGTVGVCKLTIILSISALLIRGGRMLFLIQIHPGKLLKT